jgi:succinylglutamate desuccinylase
MKNYYKQPVFFTVGVHGDEHSPINAAKKVLCQDQYLVCNPQASKINKRFVESDLNRSFPGVFSVTLEEKIAQNLVKVLATKSLVVDIHTATCATPPFIITTSLSAKHMGLAMRTGVKKVVLMTREFGAGKSLIDFVQTGISLESGKEKSIKTQKLIEIIINRINVNKRTKINLDIYEVIKTMVKQNPREFLLPKIRSFKLIKAGTKITNLGEIAEFDFYPVLARSKNYENFLCLMAQKKI